MLENVRSIAAFWMGLAFQAPFLGVWAFAQGCCTTGSCVSLQPSKPPEAIHFLIVKG